MLPANHRFNPRNQRDFFSVAKKYHSPLFSIYFIKGDRENLRATVVVSKKNAKLSTQRNQIRRKFTAAIKELLGEYSQISIDLVVVVKQKGVSATEQEVVQSLGAFLQEFVALI